MRYDQNLLDDIRSANSIVDVIGEYVPLKKSGADYKAPCPFHNETKPSFTVSPRLQIFKCFGCGKGGNVFTFLMEYEKITFNEAVKKLADRVGIKLPAYKEQSKEEKSLYNSLYGIYESALRYYHNNLTSKENDGLAYLQSRNVSDKDIKTFHLGLAQKTQSALYEHLIKRGFAKGALAKSGLFANSNGGLRDKFFDRIMFPVYSSDGKVIAFGSRIYKEGDDRGAKYLNSPETTIYQKRKHLYGLYQTKDSIIKNDSAILVEGNIDLIALWHHGFKNVVASLGTALTEEQAKLLSRYTKNIYILYDSDSAGKDAAARALNILITQSIFPKLILLPANTDPDDFLEEHGAGALRDYIDDAKTFYGFIYEIRNADKNLDNKRRALNDVIAILDQIENPVQKELYVQECANLFGVSETNVFRALQALKKKSWKPKDPLNLHVDPYREEKNIIQLIISHPEQCADYFDEIEIDYFTHPLIKKLFKLFKTNENPDLLTEKGAHLLDYFDPQDADFISDLLFAELPFSRNEFEKMLLGLQIRKLNVDLNTLNEYIIKHPDNEEKIQEKKAIKHKINQLKKDFKGGTVKKLLS
ncbi:MAG TPA: DNA primase [Candidatus Cloacimonetes bacterium]|nr:DNA primase [Candidatus Cloacimonadota bacterium]